MEHHPENEGPEEAPVILAEPAYNVAGMVPLLPGERPGSHCSNSADVCFLCVYEANVGANETDLYGSIVALIKRLTALGREPATIAHHVRDAYKQQVQACIEGEPDWPLSSIIRHLMMNQQSTFRPVG